MLLQRSDTRNKIKRFLKRLEISKLVLQLIYFRKQMRESFKKPQDLAVNLVLLSGAWFLKEYFE